VTRIGRAETVSQQWNTVKAGAFLQRAGVEACAFEKAPGGALVIYIYADWHVVHTRLPQLPSVSFLHLLYRVRPALKN